MPSTTLRPSSVARTQILFVLADDVQTVRPGGEVTLYQLHGDSIVTAVLLQEVVCEHWVVAHNGPRRHALVRSRLRGRAGAAELDNMCKRLARAHLVQAGLQVRKLCSS